MKKYLIGNWKSNGDRPMVVNFFNYYNQNVIDFDFSNVKIAIAPPFTLMQQFNEFFEHKIELCAQNVSHRSNDDNFTGDITCDMLFDIEAKYSIINHSDIKDKNDYQNIILKSRMLIDFGISFILCCDDEDVNDKDFILNVIKSGSESIRKDITMFIAYEPKKSIGTGVVDFSLIKENLLKIHDLISQFKKNKSDDYVLEINMLYGGSANEENCLEIMDLCQIDGLLIGKKSLNPDCFFNIAKKINKKYCN